MDTMRNSHPTDLTSDDSGAVALEFVLVFPFLIALVLLIGQFGDFFSKKVDVTSAARDGARSVALGFQPTTPQGMTVTVDRQCTAGDTVSNAEVTVTLTGGYDFSLPIANIVLGNKPITAKGTMRCGG